MNEAWRSYLDALGIANTPDNQANQQLVFERRNRAFIELMYQMSKRLGFPFDRVAIERNVYTPIAHGNMEHDQELIRRGIVELLAGKRALSTISWLMPGQAPLQISEVQAPPPANVAVEAPQPRQALEEGRPAEPSPRNPEQ